MGLAISVGTQQEVSYLRSKSKFYVAGWTANQLGENPQQLPKSCKGNAVVEKYHEDYLDGYGDSYANEAGSDNFKYALLSQRRRMA
jgi:hypothetical protein